MVTYGVTEDGFAVKSYADIINNLHANAQKMFGKDVDLTPGSPIKILIDMFALEMTGLWSQLKATYNSGFVTTATDVALDNLASIVGLTRDTGSYATGTVTFLRTTYLPEGSPRIISAGTIVQTADTVPIRFKTTEAVYFRPVITNESVLVTETGVYIQCKNIIHSIESIMDSQGNDLSSGATCAYRTITLQSEVEIGTTLYVTYKPLSVTAPVKAEIIGTIGNVNANAITVMTTSIDFVHRLVNESPIDTGYNIESDAALRNRIIGATQSIGKATDNALEYFIGNVTDVHNVIIDSPMTTIKYGEVYTTHGSDSFYLKNYPVKEIISIIDSDGGIYTIDNLNEDTGEVNLSVTPDPDTILLTTYSYYSPGKVKIYVEGGEVGDADTEDTIVYAIERTRAAGIQCVGYGTGDNNAYGSDDAPFSWFYRPNRLYVDIVVNITFTPSATLHESQKTEIAETVKTEITEYVNALSMSDKIYKNKLVQLAMNSDDYIVDAQLSDWKLNGIDQDISLTYIVGDNTSVPVIQTITVTHNSEE